MKRCLVPSDKMDRHRLNFYEKRNNRQQDAGTCQKINVGDKIGNDEQGNTRKQGNYGLLFFTVNKKPQTYRSEQKAPDNLRCAIHTKTSLPILHPCSNKDTGMIFT